MDPITFTPEQDALIQQMMASNPNSTYQSAANQLAVQERNNDLRAKAQHLGMTELGLARLEWEKATKDVNSPFYGMDPQTFAKEVSAMGSERYQVLDQNKVVRGLMMLGDFADSEFKQAGVAQAYGGAMRDIGDVFTNDPETLEALRQTGEELPGSVANLAPLALASIFSGGAPLIGAAGLTGLDSFTDAREGGRKDGSALGAGALAAASVGLMPATGRFFESVGANTMLKLAGDSATKAAASLRGGLLNTAGRVGIRELGQIGTGVGFDAADVALFDENRTLADLTKSEYLLPMLLSNGLTVLGQEAIMGGANSLRNRNSVTPPLRPGVAAYIAEQQKRAAELRSVKNFTKPYESTSSSGAFGYTFNQDLFPSGRPATELPGLDMEPLRNMSGLEQVDATKAAIEQWRTGFPALDVEGFPIKYQIELDPDALYPGRDNTGRTVTLKFDATEDGPMIISVKNPDGTGGAIKPGNGDFLKGKIKAKGGVQQADAEGNLRPIGGQIAPLYPDSTYYRFGSTNDAHVAAAHQIADAFDINQLTPWNVPAATKPGDFLVRMNNAAKGMGISLSRLNSVNQAMFNAIRPTVKSDADALARTLAVMDDQNARLYGNIPNDFREHGNAAKLYKINEQAIKRGTSQIVYSNKLDDVVALTRNNYLGSDAPRVEVYKGGVRMTDAESADIMAKHGDGIRAGIGQWRDTVQQLVNNTVAAGGVRAGTGVAPAHAKAVGEILKGLGIDTPVYLIGDADLDSPELAAIRQAFDKKNYGMNVRLGLGGQNINVIWTRDGQGKNGLVTLMHELGHTVEEHYSKQFPQAIAELKRMAEEGIKKIDLKSLEGLRELGPAHTGFIKEFAKAVKNKGMSYSFPEYFANQFSKWALQPNAKPASVVDFYFKSVVDGLRKIWDKLKSTVGIKPRGEFKTWMDQMARKFYTNLMWDSDTAFRGLSETYLLGDAGTDTLGRAMYENPDYMFQKVVSDRLGEWHAKGREGDPRHVIEQAVSDYRKMAPQLSGFGEVNAERKLANYLGKNDPRQLGLSKHFMEKVMYRYKDMQNIGKYIDEADMSKIVRTLHSRWLVGELPGQNNRPKYGGENKLWQAVDKATGDLSKSVPPPMTLKANGEVDASGAPLQKYDTLTEAREVVEGMQSLAGYEQFSIEPQAVKGGYKIVFKYSPEANRRTFDETYTNPEMDEAVFKGSEDGESFTYEDLAMGSPEDTVNAVKPAITNFAHTLPEDIAMDLGTLGLYTPTEASGRLGKAIMKAIGSGRAPEPLLRALDRVHGEASRNVDFHDDLRSIGKELGYEGATIDGLVDKVVNKLTRGESVKELALLAPEPFAGLIRELGATVEQYGRVTEFGARLGSQLGLHEQSLEQLKGMRGAAAELMTMDQATDRLAKLVAGSTEGGMAKRLESMQHNASLPRRAYESFLNGFQNLAANNPMLKPFAQATDMERRDQFRMMNDTLTPLHADDPNAVKYVDKVGETYSKIRKSPELNQNFDDIVRLQQIKRAGFNELVAAQDPEAMALFNKLDSQQKGTVMDMLERMQKAQLNRVQLQATEARQLDRLNLATFLVRQMPQMTPDQARVFVDTLYATPTEMLGQVMKEAGVPDGLAQRLFKHKNEMDLSTSQMVSRMQSAPWYVSEQRMSRFLVRYFDSEQGRTGAASFDTRQQAEDWIKAQGKGIKARPIEDQEIKAGGKLSNDFRETLDSTIKSKQNAIEAMFGDDPELAASMNSVLDDIFQSVDSAAVASTKGTLNINRKHSSGRETLDMLDQQVESIRRATVGMTRARTNAIYNLHRMDPFFQTPEGSRQYKLAASHLKNFRTPDTELGNAATKFGFAMTLAGNISSAMTEVASAPLVLSPLLREAGVPFLESSKMQKRIIGELGKMYMSKDGKFGKGKEDWDMVIERARKENALTARHLVDVDDQVMRDLDTHRTINGIGAKVRSLPEQVFKLATKIYEPGAQVSGSLSLLAGYEASKKLHPNRTFEQHYQAGIDLLSLAQGAGGKANRPVGMFSTEGSARTLSQAAYTLQGFANAQVGNFLRQARKSFRNDPSLSPAERKNARAALAQSMALTVGLVGLSGIPLAKALSMVAEKATGYNPEKELEKFIFEHAPGDDAEKALLTNFAMRGGAYASGLPFDLQGRMAVGGLMALNNYDGFSMDNLAGVPGSFVVQAMQAMGAMVRGEGVANEVLDMTPAALRRAAQLWANDGKIVKNGQVMLEPNAMETAAAVLGFQPSRLKRSYDQNTAAEYFEKKEEQGRKAAVGHAVELLNNGRANEAQRYIAEQSTRLAGMSSPADRQKQLTDAVARAYAQVNTPMALNPGRSGQAPMLQEIYGASEQTSQTQLYLREMQAKLLMGAAPRVSFDRLRRAQTADRLMASDPGLGSGLAAMYARLYDQQVLPNPLGMGGNTGSPLDSMMYQTSP